jgi:hypothetical protein
MNYQSEFGCGLMLLFTLGGAYAIVGHVVLAAILRHRGVDIPRLLRGVPFFAPARYFRSRSRLRSFGLDFLSTSVTIAFILSMACALILFPEAFQPS